MPEDGPTITPPADIGISEQPWVGGTRAAAYFGPIQAHGFVPYRGKRTNLDKMTSAILPLMQTKASAIGANFVVGLEIVIDPFASMDGKLGVGWSAVGTAARLELLG